MRFSGKTVLVAGGTGGLGRATTLAFVREGARAIVTYRNPGELRDLQNEAGANSACLSGEQVDVTDEKAVRSLVTEIVQHHQRIDVLVNAVGGYAGGIKLWELDSSTMEKMLTLNLRSGYILARAVIPEMLKQKAGAVVNVSSRAAFDHTAGASAYAASKAAALALMDSLAEDVRGTGVRVNTILPSIIDTEPNRKAMPRADFSKWPKPDEIARVILFMCSDEARVIHGAAIPVYGSL